jgi:hypothetical protein
MFRHVIAIIIKREIECMKINSKKLDLKMQFLQFYIEKLE